MGRLRSVLQLIRPLLKSCRNFFYGLPLRLLGASIDPSADIKGPLQVHHWGHARGLFIGPNAIIWRGVSFYISADASIRIEKDVEIRSGCRLETHSNLHIGRGSVLNFGTIIVADGSVTIAEEVLIAPYVFITDHDHATDDLFLPIKQQGNCAPRPVYIGPGSWLGTKATVCKGVTIGQGVVVGAHGMVNKDIPDYGVAVGIPAKIVRYRTECEYLERLSMDLGPFRREHEVVYAKPMMQSVS